MQHHKKATNNDHTFRQAVAHKGELHFICSKKAKHRQAKKNAKHYTKSTDKNHRKRR
ncbi:hypothetical protein [Oceanicoccus sagamiensis]|uniref:hypothetical protein n=1 Tax=Oceanicoccus sagamiensis TaxID=716816 RepID=UPI0012F48123|nr:hypothetical protein [Oceanicoccus sagamiensis]